MLFIDHIAEAGEYVRVQGMDKLQVEVGGIDSSPQLTLSNIINVIVNTNLIAHVFRV
jgi:hypothetical protein